MGELIPLQTAGRIHRPGRPPSRVVVVSDDDVADIVYEVERFGRPQLADEIISAILGELPSYGRAGAT